MLDTREQGTCAGGKIYAVIHSAGGLRALKMALTIRRRRTTSALAVDLAPVLRRDWRRTAWLHMSWFSTSLLLSLPKPCRRCGIRVQPAQHELLRS